MTMPASAVTRENAAHPARAGSTIARYFTKAGTDALDMVSYEKRDCVILEPDGKIVFEMRDLEIPAEWSQLATDIAASKYFRKAGVPARLKRVAEKGIPEWLSRHEGDPDASDALRYLARELGMPERDARALWAAFLLAPSLDVCEALLLGVEVPAHRLDPARLRLLGR